jgi:hypothetical protein
VTPSAAPVWVKLAVAPISGALLAAYLARGRPHDAEMQRAAHSRDAK